MSRLSSKLALDALTVTGKTLGENLQAFRPINPLADQSVISTLITRILEGEGLKLFTIVDGYTLFALRCNVKSVFGKYADKSS